MGKATMFIWENHLFDSHRVRVHSTIGHASLNIGNNWHSMRLQNNAPSPLLQRNEYYVSWWPGNSSERPFWPTLKLKKYRYAEPCKNIYSDINNESDYVPDHILSLDSASINEAKMKAKWDAIRNKTDAHYRKVAKNCSGVVARVLLEGVVDRLGPLDESILHFMNTVIWTPLAVMEMGRLIARDLNINNGNPIITWADFVRELRTEDMINDNGRDHLLELKKRDEAVGTSGAPSRFTIPNGPDNRIIKIKKRRNRTDKVMFIPALLH